MLSIKEEMSMGKGGAKLLIFYDMYVYIFPNMYVIITHQKYILRKLN